jgi:hypothetical protein
MAGWKKRKLEKSGSVYGKDWDVKSLRVRALNMFPR